MFRTLSAALAATLVAAGCPASPCAQEPTSTVGTLSAVVEGQPWEACYLDAVGGRDRDFVELHALDDAPWPEAEAGVYPFKALRVFATFDGADVGTYSASSMLAIDDGFAREDPDGTREYSLDPFGDELTEDAGATFEITERDGDRVTGTFSAKLQIQRSAAERRNDRPIEHLEFVDGRFDLELRSDGPPP